MNDRFVPHCRLWCKQPKGRLSGGDILGSHFLPALISVIANTTIFRITTVIATLAGFPEPISRS